MSDAPPEWKPARFLEHARIREIPRALLKHRRVLGIGYAAVWLAFWIADFLWPRAVANLLQLKWDKVELAFNWENLWARFVVFVLFFGSQLAFSWAIAGTGRQPSAPQRNRRAIAAGLSGLLATICVLCVLLVLVTVTVPESFPRLLHACAALLSGVGGAFGEWRKVPSWFFLLTAVVWSLMTGASRWLVGRQEKEVIAWRLVAMLLVTVGLTLGISLPLELALASQQNGGPGTLILVFPLLLWALGPSVYLLNLVSLRPRVAGTSSGKTGFVTANADDFLDATEYISLARSYSIILLAALYLAIDGCRAHLARTASLHDARQAWATLFVQEKYQNEWATNGVIDEMILAPAVGTVTIATPTSSNARRAVIQSAQRRDISGNAPEYNVVVNRTDERRWKATVGREIENASSQPNGGLRAPTDANTRLRGAYQSIYGTPPTSDDYNKWLGDVEYDRGDAAVPILGIELKFKSETVPWVFSLLAMGFVIQIRNQVRRGLMDPSFGLEEPWLVLDGQSGLERGLAVLWLLLVAVAPWVTNGCLFAYLGTARAAGALEESGLVLARMILAVPLWLAGAQISLSVCAEILRLRRLRLGRLNLVKEHVETEMVFRGP